MSTRAHHRRAALGQRQDHADAGLAGGAAAARAAPCGRRNPGRITSTRPFTPRRPARRASTSTAGRWRRRSSARCCAGLTQRRRSAADRIGHGAVRRRWAGPGARPGRRPISPRGSGCRCCWCSTCPASRRPPRRWRAGSSGIGPGVRIAGRGAEPRRQRAASRRQVRQAMAQVGAEDARQRAARRDRSRCRNAISAWCRRGSMPDLRRHLDRLADLAERHLRPATPSWPAPTAFMPTALRAQHCCRRPGSASRWRAMPRSASSTRMCWTAGARPGGRSCHFRRSPTRPPPDDCDCCWLPGGYPELHGATLAAARAIPRRTGPFRSDAAGAWRVRRLHGAGHRAGGCGRRAARACSACSATPPVSPTAAASRLPRGDAARRCTARPRTARGARP